MFWCCVGRTELSQDKRHKTTTSWEPIESRESFLNLLNSPSNNNNIGRNTSIITPIKSTDYDKLLFRWHSLKSMTLWSRWGETTGRDDTILMTQWTMYDHKEDIAMYLWHVASWPLPLRGFATRPACDFAITRFISEVIVSINLLHIIQPSSSWPTLMFVI